MNFLILPIPGESIEILFLIRSQPIPPHSQLGQHLKENLTRQATQHRPNYNIKVHILHELFNYPGQWTILHIMSHLMAGQAMGTTTAATPTKQIDNGMELITNLTRWIIFCEETTSINVRQLLARLTDENHKQVFGWVPLWGWWGGTIFVVN